MSDRLIYSVCMVHNMIKQCAFIHVGPENKTMGCPNPRLNLHYVGASHGYILRAHMKEFTLLNDVMY
jgi:hypothetical protein